MADDKPGPKQLVEIWIGESCLWLMDLLRRFHQATVNRPPPASVHRTVRRTSSPFSLILLAALAGSSWGVLACADGPADSTAARGTAADEELPPGVEQLLPRGGIPAVFDPTFVGAAEADVPDDAWVLGVEMDGQARAYSLNLLNRHEVVNDEIGGRSFAAVW